MTKSGQHGSDAAHTLRNVCGSLRRMKWIMYLTVSCRFRARERTSLPCWSFVSLYVIAFCTIRSMSLTNCANEPYLPRYMISTLLKRMEANLCTNSVRSRVDFVENGREVHGLLHIFAVVGHKCKIDGMVENCTTHSHLHVNVLTSVLTCKSAYM